MFSIFRKKKTAVPISDGDIVCVSSINGKCTDYVWELRGEVGRNICCGDTCTLCVTSVGNVWFCGFISASSSFTKTRTLLESQSPMRIHFSRSPGIQSISCGENHCVAIDFGGQAFVWGQNAYGQLGLNDVVDRAGPERLETVRLADGIAPAGQMILKASGGSRHTALVTKCGLVLVCGRDCVDATRPEGSVDMILVPTVVPYLEDINVVDVSCGSGITCVLSDCGDVFVWGNGRMGQCGNGQLIDTEFPTGPITLPEAVTSISCGRGGHIVAVSRSGSVYG